MKKPNPPAPKLSAQTLEYQLCEKLNQHLGEHGHCEDPVDCLHRIVNERDTAMRLLALDRLRKFELEQHNYWPPPLPVHG